MFQDGATPLFLAAQEGHVTVIRQLLTSGAKVNQAREVKSLPLQFKFLSAFLIPPSLIFLFSSSSSCHCIPPPYPGLLQDGTAPLWMGAQMGHSEVVRVLLLRGADRDADRKVGCSFRIIKAHINAHTGFVYSLVSFSPKQFDSTAS